MENNAPPQFELIDCASVTREVIRLHGRPQDLEEGDLLHRLDRFNRFVAKPVAVSEIDLNEFSLCEDTVAEFMTIYKATKTYPPIVFDAIDGSVIDGLHRANALARLGLVDIDAYVGTAENLDADWSPAQCDEDEEDQDENEECVEGEDAHASDVDDDEKIVIVSTRSLKP